MVAVNEAETGCDVESGRACDKCSGPKQCISVGMTKANGMRGVWICKGCGFIELSNVDFPVVLRPPDEEELRLIMQPGLLANVIRVMQRNARLGPAPGCDCPMCQAMKPTTISIATEPPSKPAVPPVKEIGPLVNRLLIWMVLWRVIVAGLAWASFAFVG